MGTMKKTIHSEENRILVTWLKEQRIDQGLTMRALSSRLGLPHSFIGKVEQGERRLDVVEYLQYCQALKISPMAGLEIVIQQTSIK